MIVDQPTPRLEPACDGHYMPFWQLIDRPNNTHLAAELANEFCGTCPMRDTHLYVTNAEDENWAPAAYTIRQALAVAARKATDAA